MLDRSSLATRSLLLWVLVSGCGPSGTGAPSRGPRPQRVGLSASVEAKPGAATGDKPGAGARDRSGVTARNAPGMAVAVGAEGPPCRDSRTAAGSAETPSGSAIGQSTGERTGRHAAPEPDDGALDDDAVVTFQTVPPGPTAAGASEQAVVVALHGLGDRPEAFAGLFRELGVAAQVLIPRAPLSWHGGYAWFPIELWHLDSHETAVEIERASGLVERALARWKGRYGWQRDPILVGYSQGGMIALRLATRREPPIRRAIVVSGWLPRELLPTERAQPDAPRLIALHGERDHIVPLGPTREAGVALQALGYPFELRVLGSTAHRFDEPMKAALRETLRRVLAEEISSASR